MFILNSLEARNRVVEMQCYSFILWSEIKLFISCMVLRI